MPSRPTDIPPYAEYYDLITSSTPACPDREQELGQHIPSQFLELGVAAAAPSQRIQVTPQTPSSFSQASSQPPQQLRARLSFWIWRKDAPTEKERKPQSFGGVISHPINSCFVQGFDHFIEKELLPALDPDLGQYSREPDDIYKLALGFTKKPIQPVFLSQIYNKESHTTELYPLFYKKGLMRDINVIIIRKEAKDEPDQVKQEPGARDAHHPGSERVRSWLFEYLDLPDAPADDVDDFDFGFEDTAIFFKKRDPAPARDPTPARAPATAPAGASARAPARAPPSRQSAPKRPRAVSYTASPPQTRSRARDRLQVQVWGSQGRGSGE
ncbi:hypothetical protein N7510_008801 [Penicillium lagena]|uniref:uncharacterized protein n=1 Tax=Penicillium lagena TaxID=94218 RepID=UPI00253FCCAE|nr:uncharacterized protein N7510_008801 [Penicillium lagena]KAJ5606020.1 hypothetical protein N7510_008801 [Penicillium lagena]